MDLFHCHRKDFVPECSNPTSKQSAQKILPVHKSRVQYREIAVVLAKGPQPASLSLNAFGGCDELSACRRHRLAMHPSELRFGLMVHIEPGEQLHQLDIAAALRLQMPRTANLIQIIVQI